MQDIQSECAWLLVGNDKPNTPVDECPKARQPGAEPATCRSRVRRLTHDATERNNIVHDEKKTTEIARRKVCGLRFAETGKILPAVFGRWRYDKTYNPYRDIRKNLFKHYDSRVEPHTIPSWVTVYSCLCDVYNYTTRRPFDSFSKVI